MTEKESEESFIKTPRQLVIVVTLALVLPIIAIVLLVDFVTNRPRTGAGSAAMSDAAIEQRIRPVAGFELASAAPPGAPGDAAGGAATGKTLYESACAACHATGAANAPKFADKGVWAPRIATGVDAMLATVIKGKNAMPPRGGRADASDADLRAAVEYMADAAK